MLLVSILNSQTNFNKDYCKTLKHMLNNTYNNKNQETW